MNNSTTTVFNKKVKSWIAYDVGNSAFATTVVAGFFPVFYNQYWASGIDVDDATVYKTLALAICNSIVLLTAPFIGAITDINNATKKISYFIYNHWSFICRFTIYTFIRVVVICLEFSFVLQIIVLP